MEHVLNLVTRECAVWESLWLQCSFSQSVIGSGIFSGNHCQHNASQGRRSSGWERQHWSFRLTTKFKFIFSERWLLCLQTKAFSLIQVWCLNTFAEPEHFKFTLRVDVYVMNAPVGCIRSYLRRVWMYFSNGPLWIPSLPFAILKGFFFFNSAALTFILWLFLLADNVIVK